MKKLLAWLRAIGAALVLIALSIPILGPPLYVELRGEEAPGVVLGKREEIVFGHASWSRRLYLDVGFSPADTGDRERAAISVGLARYEGAAVEDEVLVRYMPVPELRQLGWLGAPRLADQPPLGQLGAQIGDRGGLLLGAALWLAGLALWSRWRRQWLAVSLGLALLGFAIYAASNPPPPAPPGPQLRATASVERVHEVDRLLSGRSGRDSTVTVQPYTLVELRFTPAGARWPVAAVDKVDRGSVAGLVPGATLPIRYSAADPRWAQLDGATRSYAWKNLLTFAPLGALLLIGAVAAWRALSGAAGRRRQPAP